MNKRVKKLILDLCFKKRNDWECWEGHIKYVVKCSKFLAKKLGANVEIVELAAWLHDIAKLKGIPNELHHIEGAKQAKELLKNLNYSEKIINHVGDCILSHSFENKYTPKTLEAKIVASADAMFFFDNFLEIVKENNSKDGLIKKMDYSWKKIMPEAKELAKEQYNAISVLLKKRITKTG